jgi:hypothetical protein
MLYAQVPIALLGILLMYLGWFKFGRTMVRNPYAFVIGLLLVLQLALPTLIWFVAGLSSIGDSFRQVQATFAPDHDPEEANAEDQAQATRSLIITGVIMGFCLLGALIMLIIALRQPDVYADLAMAQAGVISTASGEYVVTKTGQLPQLRPPETLPLVDRPVEKTPDLPPEVNTYRGTAQSVPLEVIELGEAHHLHKSLSQVRLPFTRAPKTPTYIVFKQAVVLVQGDDFTVIPWSALQEVNANDTIVTTDGQQFELARNVANFKRLHEKLQRRVRERALPPLLDKLNTGDWVTFGPVAFCRREIRHEDKKLPWNALSGLVILTQAGTGKRRLLIRAQGISGFWAEVQLHSVPNDWLMIELLQQVAPPHLLKAPAKA